MQKKVAIKRVVVTPLVVQIQKMFQLKTRVVTQILNHLKHMTCKKKVSFHFTLLADQGHVNISVGRKA